jgi:hypothetical protein
VNVRSRPFAAARRGVRHLLGRHTLRVQVGGSVSGLWLWRVDCRCGLLERGAEPGREQAQDAAYAAAGGERDVESARLVFGPRASRAWPEEPMLREQAKQFVLPEHLRGVGSVVAADASRRDSDAHAGWGFVTDSGWHRRGIVDYATANVAGVELLAIAQALQLYPDGHYVDVLSDNLDARLLAARIFARRARHWADMPAWVPVEAHPLLLKAAHPQRRLQVRVLAVKSKTHPLHNIADRLARGRDFDDLLEPKEET